MENYKGFYIWHNSARTSKPWLVQSGYEIIGEYATIGAAKGAITRGQIK